MAITAVAGPVSNFILAFIVMLVLYPIILFGSAGNTIVVYTFEFLLVLFRINIVLGIFNLLPIPPLDGSKVFSLILPESVYFRFISFRHGFIVLIILIYTGLTANIIFPLMSAMQNGYFRIIGYIYSLFL
jgi:Zn-dependent protease